MSDEKPKTPDIYDKIYCSIQEKKLGSDFFLLLFELFWPSFILYESYVFLKEAFKKDKFDELIQFNHNPEFWINFQLIDGFFDDPDEAEKSIPLAKKLVDIWKIKLKNEFPDLEFVVEFLDDEELGEHGLTFYQKGSKLPP